MKVLNIDDEYKVFPSLDGKEYVINDRFPLHWLTYYLSVYREYNKSLTINHIKNYYDIDISNLLDADNAKYIYWNNENIYESYTTRFPRDGFDLSDRTYFQNKGRNYFLKFTKNPHKDFVNNNAHMDVVHHIYPLVFGGTNKLENLIGVSNFNHSILHSNSRESEEKYCHQAVDYLWYLYSYWDTDKNKRILDKYGITDLYENDQHNHQFIVDVYLSAIKSEMNEFYQYIKEK